MPFAPVNGIDLYYELHGPKPPEAPAIVFAHGAGGNHLSWFQQVPHFRDRFACLVFDHRGFGLSDDAPDGPGGAAFADDLRALLDHCGIERATLVAQSMGGWTCLRFAVQHPERVERLMMCDTHGGLTTPAIDAFWREYDRPAAPPEGVHPAAGARMQREQAHMQFLYREIEALNPTRSRAELNALLKAAGSLTPDDVRELTFPVLFIVGEEDIVIPPRVIELSSLEFCNVRVEHVSEAGHSVYFERPQRFNAILDAFLRGDA